MTEENKALLAAIDAFNEDQFILANSSTKKMKKAIEAYLDASDSVIVSKDVLRELVSSLLDETQELKGAWAKLAKDWADI